MDVDGNNVGDSPCDKVSEGVVQFQCIYTGPVSNIQIIINYVSNLIFKGCRIQRTNWSWFN